MDKEELKAAIMSLELCEFHELIKQEAVRRCNEGVCYYLDRDDLGEEHMALLTLAHLTYFNGGYVKRANSGGLEQWKV